MFSVYYDVKIGRYQDCCRLRSDSVYSKKQRLIPTLWLFLKELNEETNVEVNIGDKEGLVSSKNKARYLPSLHGGEIQPLEGHNYEGVLVPMTKIVNVFQEVASEFRDGLKLCLRDLRVFRPLRIESLQKGLKVEIEIQENEAGILIHHNSKHQNGVLLRVSLYFSNSV